jgi:RNA polymerase sigma-70 factor (sigma-E family)
VASTVTGVAWDGSAMVAADPSSTWTADEAVARLYTAHYRSLVRLAGLLLSDAGLAEEITQDAYVQLHVRWRRLRDTDKALGYLRTAVVNGCRSALRRRLVERRYLANVPAGPMATVPSAEADTIARLGADALIAALRQLPTRQREALVLRYYLDLSELAISEAMGCSRGAVKSHLSRGLAALRAKVVPHD